MIDLSIGFPKGFISDRLPCAELALLGLKLAKRFAAQMGVDLRIEVFSAVHEQKAAHIKVKMLPDPVRGVGEGYQPDKEHLCKPLNLRVHHQAAVLARFHLDGLVDVGILNVFFNDRHCFQACAGPSGFRGQVIQTILKLVRFQVSNARGDLDHFFIQRVAKTFRVLQNCGVHVFPRKILIQAPYLATRPALANASGITCLAGMIPRLPRLQTRSPNSAMPSARTLRP